MRGPTVNNSNRSQDARNSLAFDDQRRGGVKDDHAVIGRDNRRISNVQQPIGANRDFQGGAGIRERDRIPSAQDPYHHHPPLNSAAPLRAGPSNSIMSTSPLPTYARSTVYELVAVPADLSAFAADPQFQQILLKVKEQTAINFVSLNRISENCVESVAIDAPSKESASLARSLIETHFKLQTKLKAAESRLHKVQTDLFSAQGEIASGMMVEFTVSPDLVGVIIGKKGARIRQIEQDTGVSTINVNGETGKITIIGPDASSVQRAREHLELFEDSFELTPQHAQWLNDKYNSGVLTDIKSISSLVVARVNMEKCTLDVIGIHSAVRSARLMIATQLEYVDKQIEIEQSERNAREKLQAVRKQYGMGFHKRSAPGDEDPHNGGNNYNNNYKNGSSNNNRDRIQHSNKISSNIAASAGKAAHDPLVDAADSSLPPPPPSRKQPQEQQNNGGRVGPKKGPPAADNSNNNKPASAPAAGAAAQPVAAYSRRRDVAVTEIEEEPLPPPPGIAVANKQIRNNNSRGGNNNRNAKSQEENSGRSSPKANQSKQHQQQPPATPTQPPNSSSTASPASMLEKINAGVAGQKSETTNLDETKAADDVAAPQNNNKRNNGNRGRKEKPAVESEEPVVAAAQRLPPKINRTASRSGAATATSTAKAKDAENEDLSSSLKSALKISSGSDTAASKEEKSKLHDVKGKEKEKEKERKDSVPLEGLSLREALSVAKEQQK